MVRYPLNVSVVAGQFDIMRKGLRHRGDLVIISLRHLTTAKVMRVYDVFQIKEIVARCSNGID